MDMEIVLDYVTPKVTTPMNVDLLKPYLVDEVGFALFQMHPLKALGLDDFYPMFFSKILAYWGCIFCSK